MQAHWLSRKGRQRQGNCDAGALALKDYQVCAIIVDAAEHHGTRPGEFANHWAQQVIQFLSVTAGPVQPQQACAILREAQRQLRDQYLLEIGSYCLVMLNAQQRTGVLLHTGDCIAAVALHDHMRWLVKPHTLPGQGWVIDQAERHRLTRSLNARRFSKPGVCQFDLPQGASLHLCTDGYWAEHLQEKIPLHLLQDDASNLRLEIDANQPDRLTLESDIDNFYVDANLRHLSTRQHHYPAKTLGTVSDNA
ncbi:hypothetical protein [Pseudomonas jilinensis]|uniref:Protein phosphatase 2C domain-containing protein n=1 Tax=Pseudomonas jilinensis TaxID=2078689 RepID=A0A396S829_9PSED|nr:hypothetical protein [Pseudomonas jilinensis]RHW19565.1 hypothetical protein C2846_18125 [Pseudomonas jilinensis]